MQCVAVTTQSGSIKEPPQNCLPLLSCNIACQGQLLTGAIVPPTIREMLGREPQETESDKQHICKPDKYTFTK